MKFNVKNIRTGVILASSDSILDAVDELIEHQEIFVNELCELGSKEYAEICDEAGDVFTIVDENGEPLKEPTK